jgi:hypothetical protein
MLGIPAGLVNRGKFIVASRADEYRQRARQCLEMAGTFRDRKSRVALSHMAQVWLTLADRYRGETYAPPPAQQQQQIQRKP